MKWKNKETNRVRMSLLKRDFKKIDVNSLYVNNSKDKERSLSRFKIRKSVNDNYF